MIHIFLFLKALMSKGLNNLCHFYKNTKCLKGLNSYYYKYISTYTYNFSKLFLIL